MSKENPLLAIPNESGDQTVSFPHTRNYKDVQDDEPGFYKGEAVYRKKMQIPASHENKTIYICFDGLAINFKAVKGKTMLNAIRILKVN